jgi:hypothetical protein
MDINRLAESEGLDDDDLEGEGGGVELTGDELIEYKILCTLVLYPRVSPSMMQCALGANTAPRYWRPILNRMVDEGKVLRLQRSVVNKLTGRWRTAIILCLPGSEQEGEMEGEETGFDVRY